MDKNKNIKKFLASHMESLAYTTSGKVQDNQLKEFHEFLHGYTDIFSKNIFATKDYSYHHLDLSTIKTPSLLRGIKILVL